MSDIVERLRRRHEQAAENYGELDLTLWSEAADEIERLRKALDTEKRWNSTLEITARKDGEEAATEIERLRTDLANECERRDEIIASETHLRKEAEAEIERLRFRSERGWP